MGVFLEDRRVRCLSGVGQFETGEYLALIADIYKENGGIEGQRAPLKTKTGINIRKRMIEDIKQGAILPPIVIGAVVTDEVFEKARSCENNDEFASILRSIENSSLSIIDGMQRTTALDSAVQDGNTQEISNVIRIDLWLAKSIDSLIYRMLVLNTGQVPWDIKRQLETIYKHVLTAIKEEIPDISVFNIDETERRSGAGQYRAARIIELFLSFTSRKPHIELKEKVAEDFARMEATEAVANEKTLPAFIETMKLLATLDHAFAKTSMNPEWVHEGTRFKSGADIFTSSPASIGFAAAAAEFLLGRPGYAFEFDQIAPRLSKLRESVTLISQKIEDNDADFIDYLTLNEKISARSGRIGEYEREFFFRAFSRLFEDAADLTSLSPCWFAYK